MSCIQHKQLVWLMAPRVWVCRCCQGYPGCVRAQPGAQLRLAALPRAAPGRQQPGSQLIATSPGKNHIPCQSQTRNHPQCPDNSAVCGHSAEEWLGRYGQSKSWFEGMAA